MIIFVADIVETSCEYKSEHLNLVSVGTQTLQLVLTVSRGYLRCWHDTQILEVSSLFCKLEFPIDTVETSLGVEMWMLKVDCLLTSCVQD